MQFLMQISILNCFDPVLSYVLCFLADAAPFPQPLGIHVAGFRGSGVRSSWAPLSAYREEHAGSPVMAEVSPASPRSAALRRAPPCSARQVIDIMKCGVRQVQNLLWRGVAPARMNQFE